MTADARLLRRIAERLTARLVVRRHLPRQFGGGPILVSAAGGLKYLGRPMGAVDPMLLRVAGRFVHRNACVWDIGANVGLFTFAAAARAGSGGRVFALEADSWCAALLRRSTRLGGDRAPVTVISAAVAESCGLREFKIAARARASNALAGYGLSQMGGVAETQTVITVSLDWLASFLPPPDVLKIDVEGAEAEVLRGATGLFGRSRPIVLCEVAEINVAEVSDFFLSRGYDLYDADSSDVTGKLARAAMNALCLPR